MEQHTDAVPELQSGIFDGLWSNGVIHGDKLTWHDDAVSKLFIDEATKVLQVTWQEISYRGELRADGKIYWSDGDVWNRGPHPPPHEAAAPPPPAEEPAPAESEVSAAPSTVEPAPPPPPAPTEPHKQVNL